MAKNCKTCQYKRLAGGTEPCVSCAVTGDTHEIHTRWELNELDAIRAALAPFLSNPTGDVVQDLRNVLAPMLGYKGLYNDALDTLEATLGELCEDNGEVCAELGRHLFPEYENSLAKVFAKARALLAARRKADFAAKLTEAIVEQGAQEIDLPQEEV